MEHVRRARICRIIAGLLLLSSAALVGACGGADRSATAPIPVPSATPVPVPTPTPDPNVPPLGSACGKPYPPPISRLHVKVLYKGQESWTVDSTPLVGPNQEYCHSIGFVDGRSICPLRPEGAPDRAACEEWRAGTAKDTGQPGPTWTFIEPGTGKESYCSSAEGAPCDHHPNGPFTVKAYKGGTYRVCTEAGACAETLVDRNL